MSSQPEALEDFQKNPDQRKIVTRATQRPKSKEMSVKRSVVNSSKQAAKQFSVENPRPRLHSLDKKTKKKGKKKKKQVVVVDDRDEELQLEEEMKRREQLLKFKREQEEKLTEEERKRLKDEQQELEEIVRTWEQEVYELQKKKQIDQEWEDYLMCSTRPNPKSEKDLNTFAYQLDEINTPDQDLILKKIQYAFSILDDVEGVMMDEKAGNRFEQMDYFISYTKKIKMIINRKLEQIVHQFIKNYENYLEEKNVQLKQQFFPQFKPDNFKQILINLSKKNEERYKYEIIKFTPENQVLKIAVWYNPISKAGFRAKAIDFQELNELQIELPRTFMGSSLIYQVTWCQYDLFSEMRVYDQYLTISGIFIPRLFELAKISKRTSKWALKPNYDDPQQFVKQIQYDGNQPMKVSFKIPKTFYLTDNVFMVSRNSFSQWTLENSEELSVQLDKRIVTCNIKRLYPFMLAQQRFCDFPFKRWQLSQKNQDEAYLRIQTQRGINLLIKIMKDSVQLLESQELIDQFPELQSDMEASKLFIELRSRGINLIACEEDGVCKNIEFKINELENQALLNMMQTLHIFSFQNSSWNPYIGKSKIAYQIIENINGQIDVKEDDEFQWKTVEIDIHKCALLKVSNNSKEYDNKWLDDTVSHSNLQILFQSHQLLKEEMQETLFQLGAVELKTQIRRVCKYIHLLSIN